MKDIDQFIYDTLNLMHGNPEDQERFINNIATRETYSFKKKMKALAELCPLFNIRVRVKVTWKEIK